MILRCDSGSTERETNPSRDHWSNDTEMGQWKS
jgi:hypothetical protein